MDFALRNNLFIFFSIVALAFMLFGNGIDGDFVFDDRSIITDSNPLIEDWSGVFYSFLNPYHYARPQSGLYRPLTFASYVIDWHIFSGNPAGFHVVNILLHAIGSFLIFLIVSSLKDKLTAIVSSLIFLFLPIHVEAVTSIVGRGELLAFLFFMLAFHGIQRGHYKTASALFLLSILSKETGIVFIPVFLFFEYVWRKTPAVTILKKILYFLPPLIIYIALRYNALGSNYFLNANAYSFFNPIVTMDFFPGLFMAFKVLYLYVQKTFFLTYFSSDYSYNQIKAVDNLFSSWQAMAGIVIFGTTIYLAISRRNSLVGLGAFIFLFSYLIVSNLFIKIGTIMAERLMYLPSLGFALVISGFFSDLLNRYKKLTKLIWAILIFVLIVYAVQIIRGNALWKSEKVLFENAYKNAPNSVVNMTNMASVLSRDGKNVEALEKIELALAVEPNNSPALHLAGQIYKDMRESKKAEAAWLKAIQAQPDYLYPYLSLGALYYNQGSFELGKEILVKANQIHDTSNVIFLLAFNKIGLGEYAEIIDLVEDRFGKKPKEYESRFILGLAYLKSGNRDKARRLLLELKDPTLTEDIFFQNLKDTEIFGIEI